MSTTVSTEYVTAEMTRLLSIAQQELDRHTSDHGTCSCCDKHWPCPTACLAANALASM